MIFEDPRCFDGRKVSAYRHCYDGLSKAGTLEDAVLFQVTIRYCQKPLHIYNRIYILILIQVPMRRYRKTNNNCNHNLDYIIIIYPFYQQTFSPYDHSELYQEPPNPFQSRLSYTCNTIPHKTPIDVVSGDALDS